MIDGNLLQRQFNSLIPLRKVGLGQVAELGRGLRAGGMQGNQEQHRQDQRRLRMEGHTPTPGSITADPLVKQRNGLDLRAA